MPTDPYLLETGVVVAEDHGDYVTLWGTRLTEQELAGLIAWISDRAADRGDRYERRYLGNESAGHDPSVKRAQGRKR